MKNTWIFVLGFFLMVSLGFSLNLVVNQTDPCFAGDSYFANVGPALISSANGDNIFVCPGTYIEGGFVVAKSVRLLGFNITGSPIISGNGTITSAFNSATNIYVENITFINYSSTTSGAISALDNFSAYNIAVNNSAVSVKLIGNNINLRNVVTTSQLAGGAQFQVSGNIIQNATIKDSNVACVAASSDYFLWIKSGGAMENSTVQGNYVDNCSIGVYSSSTNNRNLWNTTVSNGVFTSTTTGNFYNTGNTNNLIILNNSFRNAGTNRFVNMQLSNSTILNNNFSSGASNKIQLNAGSLNTLIRGNLFNGTGTVLTTVANNLNNTFADNYVRDTTTVASWSLNGDVNGTAFINNTFFNLSSSVFSITNTGGVSFLNNNFSNCTSYLIIGSGMYNSNISGNLLNLVPTTKLILIYGASHDDDISFNTMWYNETNILGENMTVVGNIFNGNIVGHSLAINYLNFSQIRGNQFFNSNASIYDIDGNRTTIEGNTFTNNLYSIYSTNTFYNTTIQDNKFINSTIIAGNAIGLTIKGNSFYNHTTFPIYLTSSLRVNISDNQINDSNESAMYIFNISQSQINNNTIINAQTGLSDRSYDCTFLPLLASHISRGCYWYSNGVRQLTELTTIQATGYGGIYTYVLNNSEVKNNVIKNVSSDGIRMLEMRNSTVQGNIVNKTNMIGYRSFCPSGYLNGCKDNMIKGNWFENNSLGGMYNGNRNDTYDGNTMWENDNLDYVLGYAMYSLEDVTLGANTSIDSTYIYSNNVFMRNNTRGWILDIHNGISADHLYNTTNFTYENLSLLILHNTTMSVQNVVFSGANRLTWSRNIYATDNCRLHVNNVTFTYGVLSEIGSDVWIDNSTFLGTYSAKGYEGANYTELAIYNYWGRAYVNNSVFIGTPTPVWYQNFYGFGIMSQDENLQYGGQHILNIENSRFTNSVFHISNISSGYFRMYNVSILGIGKDVLTSPLNNVIFEQVIINNLTDSGFTFKNSENLTLEGVMFNNSKYPEIKNETNVFLGQLIYYYPTAYANQTILNLSNSSMVDEIIYDVAIVSNTADFGALLYYSINSSALGNITTIYGVFVSPDVVASNSSANRVFNSTAIAYINGTCPIYEQYYELYRLTGFSVNKTYILANGNLNSTTTSCSSGVVTFPISGFGSWAIRLTGTTAGSFEQEFYNFFLIFALCIGFFGLAIIVKILEKGLISK